jgi:hypothetical protein
MKTKIFSFTITLLFSTVALNAMDLEMAEVDISKKPVTFDQLEQAAKHKNASKTIQLLQKVQSQKNAQEIIANFKEWLNDDVKALKKVKFLYIIGAILFYGGDVGLGIMNIAVYKKNNTAKFFGSGKMLTESIIWESLIVLICLGAGIIYTCMAFSASNKINFIKQNQDKIKKIMLKIREIELIYKEKQLQEDKIELNKDKLVLEKLVNTPQ